VEHDLCNSLCTGAVSSLQLYLSGATARCWWGLLWQKTRLEERCGDVASTQLLTPADPPKGL
jgi:hypothetical protein